MVCGRVGKVEKRGDGAMSNATTKQPLDKVLRLTQKIEAALRPEWDAMVSELVWAGSVRRERPTVGDLDLVVLLRPGARHDALAPALKGISADGVLRLDGQTKKMILLRGCGIKLEVYVARPREEDLLAAVPSDFGIILHTATGSLEWNIKMTRLAREQGYRYSPFTGLVRVSDNAVLPCETEDELFAHLGLPFVPPNLRA